MRNLGFLLLVFITSITIYFIVGFLIDINK